MRERAPQPQSPFDRCLVSLHDYLVVQGRPLDYNASRQSFRPATDPANYDALGRVVTVAVADASEPTQPIMYDALLLTERGMAQTGLAARLTQVLPALDRVVQLDFTVDKTVNRTITAPGRIERPAENITQQEVAFLAEQLTTIGSASRP